MQPYRLGRIYLRSGTGAPEGNVVGSIGDVYFRTDGSTNTTLYIKESGTETAYGWVASGAAGAATTIINTTNVTNVLTGAQLGLVEATAHGYNLN